MRSLTIALSAALLISMSKSADAAEYNKRPFLDAGSQARVMNAIARSQALKGKDFDESDGERRCGEERDGVIVDRQPGNQRTIVVTEDIFNFGGTTVIESDCRR